MDLGEIIRFVVFHFGFLPPVNSASILFAPSGGTGGGRGSHGVVGSDSNSLFCLGLKEVCKVR
jgi:hypothetical protein